MNRRIAQITVGMTVAVLVACGGGGASDANQTATARTADANDAATVTAFAGGRQNTGNSGTNTNTTTGTTTAGKGGNAGIFRFATLPAGGASEPSGTAVRGTAAAGTSRTGTPPGVSGNTYTDPQGRYTFTIPQGWRIQQSADSFVNVQAAPPGTLNGVLQIGSEDVPPGTSLDDYSNTTINDLKSAVSNFQTDPSSVQDVTISGVAARRFDFTGAQGGMTLKGAIFIIRKDASVYVLLVAAAAKDFDTVFAQARATVDSFKFL